MFEQANFLTSLRPEKTARPESRAKIVRLESAG